MPYWTTYVSIHEGRYVRLHKVYAVARHDTVRYGTGIKIFLSTRFVQILVFGSFDVTTYLAFHYWKFYCVSVAGLALQGSLILSVSVGVVV